MTQAVEEGTFARLRLGIVKWTVWSIDYLGWLQLSVEEMAALFAQKKTLFKLLRPGVLLDLRLGVPAELHLGVLVHQNLCNGQSILKIQVHKRSTPSSTQKNVCRRVLPLKKIIGTPQKTIGIPVQNRKIGLTTVNVQNPTIGAATGQVRWQGGVQTTPGSPAIVQTTHGALLPAHQLRTQMMNSILAHLIRRCFNTSVTNKFNNKG